MTNFTLWGDNIRFVGDFNKSRHFSNFLLSTFFAVNNV